MEAIVVTVRTAATTTTLDNDEGMKEEKEKNPT